MTTAERDALLRDASTDPGLRHAMRRLGDTLAHQQEPALSPTRRKKACRGKAQAHARSAARHRPTWRCNTLARTSPVRIGWALTSAAFQCIVSARHVQTRRRGSMRPPPLTCEQEEALQHFAKAHGRTWKHVLWVQWMQASAAPLLHALRNSHGPNWLATYRIPRAGAPRPRRPV